MAGMKFYAIDCAKQQRLTLSTYQSKMAPSKELCKIEIKMTPYKGIIQT